MSKQPFQKLFVGEGWNDCYQMPNAAFKIWMRHYSHEQADKRESYPSLTYLADSCGMNECTVKDARRWLVANGWLVKVGERRVEGKFAVPVFRVERGTIPPQGEKPPTVKPKVEKAPAARAGKTADGKSTTESETPVNQRHVEEETSKSKTKEGSKQVMASQSAKPKADGQAWSVDNIDDLTEMQGYLMAYPVGRAHDLISKLGCNVKDREEWLNFIRLLEYFSNEMPDRPELSLWQFWNWNQQHKTGGLLFYSLADAWNSIINTDNRKGAFPQFKKHQQLVICPKHCYEAFPELRGDQPFEEGAAFEVEGD